MSLLPKQQPSWFEDQKEAKDEHDDTARQLGPKGKFGGSSGNTESHKGKHEDNNLIEIVEEDVTKNITIILPGR